MLFENRRLVFLALFNKMFSNETALRNADQNHKEIYHFTPTKIAKIKKAIISVGKM